MSRNPMLHDCSKNIDVDFHCVRNKVAQMDLAVHYVPSRLHLADVFTKGLHSSQFCFFVTICL